MEQKRNKAGNTRTKAMLLSGILRNRELQNQKNTFRERGNIGNFVGKPRPL